METVKIDQGMRAGGWGDLSLSLSVSWFCLIDTYVFLIFKTARPLPLICCLFVVCFSHKSILHHISSYLSNMWLRIMLRCSLASLQRPVYYSSCPAFELCLSLITLSRYIVFFYKLFYSCFYIVHTSGFDSILPILYL